MSVSFMEYMSAGGSIMWVILGISVLASALAIERIIFFALSSTNPAVLESSFKKALSEGGSEAALSVSAGHGSLRGLFSMAASNWRVDDEKMKILLEGQLRREIYRWAKNLPLLETAAKISPLLGLLGTVLGMVEMFRTLNVGGSVNATAVTGGIWKALFTTVAGLIVAIPVIAVHGFLSGWIDREEEILRRGIDFIMRERMERESEG
jgi:biopolymer transport protein ExbB